MIASYEESIDESLSIEIGEVIMREIVEDLRLESMIEFPDIWIALGIFHHLSEIVSDTTSLTTHDLSKMTRSTDSVYGTREEVHESILEYSECLFMKRESRVFLRGKDDRFSIADTISIKSELDTIREDELGISEIPR